MDIEEVASLDDKDIIARADAQAWNPTDDTFTSITKIEHNLEEALGEYQVTFSTASGLSITRKIIVVDQKFVKNEKANEAVIVAKRWLLCIFFLTFTAVPETTCPDTAPSDTAFLPSVFPACSPPQPNKNMPASMAHNTIRPFLFITGVT